MDNASGPSRRKNEEGLDHLVRQAMSETSLVPGTSRADAVAQLEYATERIRMRRLKMALCGLGLAIAGSTAWYFLHQRALAAALAEQQRAHERITVEANDELNPLIADAKFEEAQTALDGFGSRGLLPETAAD